MTGLRRTAVLLAIVALLCSSVVVVLADNTTGVIELTAGTLSLTPAAVTWTSFQLDGADHNDVAGSTTAWTAKDPTGSGAGWHGTILASDFVNAAGKIIAASGFEVQFSNDDISITDGDTNKPTSSVTTFAAFNTEITFISAATDQGMGDYSVTPSFQLDVPADTYAGTYTSTITTTISTGAS